MLSIQSPKPRVHCSRCNTRPEQKMSFASAGLDLAGGRGEGWWSGGSGARQRGGARQAAGSSPVGQAEDEELQEGRLQQQVAVAGAQLGEARDLLGPLANDLQGPREQVVELPHVPSILLPKVRQHQLLELGQPGGVRAQGPGQGPPCAATSCLRGQTPGGRGTEMLSTSCLQLSNTHSGGCWKEHIFLPGTHPRGYIFPSSQPTGAPLFAACPAGARGGAFLRCTGPGCGLAGLTLE